jgi:queuine tRNA-ribosyltransferase
MLVSIHNLTYYQQLLSEARKAIEEDRFAAFLGERRVGWNCETASCRLENGM